MNKNMYFAWFFFSNVTLGTIPGSKKDSNIILMLHAEGFFFLHSASTKPVSLTKPDSKNNEKSFYHCSEFK